MRVFYDYSSTVIHVLYIFKINNPDMRVQILKDFVKQHFPSTQLLDYALDVEKITTSKVKWQQVCGLNLS